MKREPTASSSRTDAEARSWIHPGDAVEVVSFFAVELTAAQNATLERRLSRGIMVSLALTGLAGILLVLSGSRYPEMGRALVIAAAVGAALRPWRLRELALWSCSAAFFLAFLGVTVVAARAANARRDPLPNLGNQVLSTHESEAYLASKGVDPKKSHAVKTGIFLTHMEFESSNNVAVSGYVWQIYPPDTPKELQKGVVFPEAVNGGYDDMQQAYDVTTPEGVQILGWHFDLTFRQRFDYAKYPFDQQDVWLRMWHRDFEQDAILIPDFEGYPPWVPSETIGLEKQFVYTGWSPMFTRFGYLENTYASTFGFGAYAPKPSFPEMVYTTSLRRLSTAPFVNHVLPLMVTYVLTFAILLFMVKDDERSFAILSSLTGLFFLTLLNHQQINTVAAADGLSFLGLASGIMYLSFFGVAANGLALARLDIPFLEWRNNLLAKLLFLPVTSFVLAVISVGILKA